MPPERTKSTSDHPAPYPVQEKNQSQTKENVEDHNQEQGQEHQGDNHVKEMGTMTPKVDKLKMKPFTKGSVQYFTEDREDINLITLVSGSEWDEPGQAFMVHKELLTRHCLYWRNLLVLPAKYEPILIKHEASVIHQVLHLLTTRDADRKLEPDPNATWGWRKTGEQPFGRAVKNHVLLQAEVPKLLREWTVQDTLVSSFRNYIIELGNKHKTFITHMILRIGCDNHWRDVVQLAVLQSKRFNWNASGFNRHRPWPRDSGLPFKMGRAEAEALGWNNYQKLVVAVTDSLILPVEKGKKVKVDWEKASKRFKVDSRKEFIGWTAGEEEDYEDTSGWESDSRSNYMGSDESDDESVEESEPEELESEAD